MGTSQQPEGSVEITMDEIERLQQAPPSPSVLEGDDIPEEFRGKTAAEVAKIAAQRTEALRTSESARLAALEAQRSAPAPVVVNQPAAPAAPAEMTQEEFDALYETDPKAALKIMKEQTEDQITRNVLARIMPLQSGMTASAEAAARAQFSTEFELFGDQIKQIVDTVPNKQFLASPKGWADIISYIRGQPENFEKLVAHKNKGSEEAARTAARQAQIESAGFSSRAPVAPPSARMGNDPTFFGLDDTERKVADNLGMSYKEYAHWKRMG